jgi:hypothetical protein
MTLTEEEQKCIQTLRQWFKREEKIKFTATFESGLWECALLDDNGDEAAVGGGPTFFQAFCNLDSE